MIKKYYRQIILSSLMLMMVAGCAPLHHPQPVPVTVTAYGETEQFAMQPAIIAPHHPTWHQKRAKFELGAYYINAPTHNELHLLVAVFARAEIKSLAIIIDEVKYTFISKAPTRQTQRLYPALTSLLAITSVKKFDVPVEIIREMLAGTKVHLEVATATGILHGDFKYDCQRGKLYYQYGCQAFTDFYQKYIVPTLK